MFRIFSKDLSKFDPLFRENKEMKSNQARVNMDTAREIQQDKAIKTKAEKDRRLKEKQSNNTKVD